MACMSTVEVSAEPLQRMAGYSSYPAGGNWRLLRATLPIARRLGVSDIPDILGVNSNHGCIMYESPADLYPPYKVLFCQNHFLRLLNTSIKTIVTTITKTSTIIIVSHGKPGGDSGGPSHATSAHVWIAGNASSRNTAMNREIAIAPANAVFIIYLCPPFSIQMIKLKRTLPQSSQTAMTSRLPGLRPSIQKEIRGIKRKSEDRKKTL